MTALGDRVYALRRQRGWSQEQLALESGVATMTVVRIKTGNTPSMGTLTKLAIALETTTAALLTDPPSGPPPG